MLHLPGEPFIEYQLAAQKCGKDRFVCVAGYGDGGLGYIPTDDGVPRGRLRADRRPRRAREEKLLTAIKKVVK